MLTRRISENSCVRIPAINDSPVPIQHYGWLRKQGGKFRTWKRRFFVLRQGSLEYYTDSDQIRLLGTLEIGPPDTMEVAACETDITADDKAFNFTVKRSKNWGSEQKQSLVLSASSSDERRDWIRALRKQLYLKIGGGLFGTHLSEVFAYTTPESKYVPRVVYQTAEFIRHYGLITDGIFRKCGSRHVIEELCDFYDMARPDPILNPNEHDAHAAAGVLKQYLRELPEPVIPYRQYDRLKATGYLIQDGQDLKPIIDQLECLPAPNYCLLQFLCQLLSEVADHNDENRMTIENLASIFAPNILRQADYDPDVEMSVTPVITLTVAGFISHYEELFRFDVTHFAQLHFAALASTSAGAATAAATSVGSQPESRLNFSEPPPETSSTSRSSLHFTPYKSGSLTDSSNSQSQGQIWFPHEVRSAGTLPRQCTIASVPTTRRMNGRTASNECDPSSGESQGSLQVGKTGSSSPSGGGAMAAPPEGMTEQLRHWRSVALVARAEAVCERAKSRALSAELARARCDLNMAETELGLLRKRLSVLESALASSRPGGVGRAGSITSSAFIPRELR